MTISTFTSHPQHMARLLAALLLFVAWVPVSSAQDDATTSPWAMQDVALTTPWAEDVSPENAWPEYPRPQMQRDAWKNLNGLWDYAITPVSANEAESYDGTILVPFAVESALSGVKRRVGADSLLWYRRTFEVPADWDSRRLLLHFGAVDWEATVFVNGQEVKMHRGGYDAFTVDVTDALRPDGRQELVVRVWDPTDEGDQARGKQVKNPGGIWYTPVTGMWQTVWLEPVPEASIQDLRLTPDVDAGVLRVRAEGRGAGSGYQVEAIARADGREVGRASGPVSSAFTVPVPDARLWTPDDPYLYDLEVRLKRGNEAVDAVDSYFAMRSVSVAEGPDGAPRLMLNGEPVFHVGPLDQGYWPDGLHTAPTDEALRFDVEMTKQLGFNATRKHVTVEPSRWYYWTDKLGLLVWQDMPNGDNITAQGKRQFERELEAMVDQFYNHPSIIAWVVFNEGWGQYDAARVTRAVEAQDPSRLVVDASGWQTRGAGHVLDAHRYQGPVAMPPADHRASIVGEFGGLGYLVEGHAWGGEGWGYEGTFASREELAERYEQLMTRMWHLKDAAHMSGGIYTQLTDLEEEVNGLLTYDRRVLKIDTSRIVAANRGHTPYITPEDGGLMGETTVTISNGAGSEIRYTLDGSVPTARSKRYDRPFTLRNATTVKARAFRDGEPVSPVVTAPFERTAGLAAASVSEEALRPGLRYQYFDQAAYQRRPFARHWPLRRYMEQGDRLEPVKEGTVASLSLAPRERDSLYAFNYEGYLRVPQTGMYTFTIHVDDGASMIIGGTEFTRRAGQSPSTTVEEMRVPLQEGLHELVLRHFQAYGPATLDVYMEGPGMARQRIPADALFHDVSTASK